MKTSNKLLLAFAFLLFATAVVAMSMIRKNLTLVNEKEIVLSGQMQTKTLLDTIDKTSFEFYGSQEVLLDPDKQGVFVTADQVIIDDITPLNGETIGLSFATYIKRSLRKDVKLTIGVKGLEMMSILAKDNAIVKSNKPLVLAALNLRAAHDSEWAIQCEVKFLNIEAEDDVFVEIDGNAYSVDIDSWNRASVDLSDIKIDMLNLKLEQDASLKIGHCKMMSGRLRDNTVAEFNQQKPEGYIESKHSSKAIYNQGSN